MISEAYVRVMTAEYQEGISKLLMENLNITQELNKTKAALKIEKDVVKGMQHLLKTKKDLRSVIEVRARDGEFLEYVKWKYTLSELDKGRVVQSLKDKWGAGAVISYRECSMEETHYA